MVELEDLLRARDERSAAIASLQRTCGLPVLVLTLNIPGPEKLPSWSERVIEAGIREMRDILGREGISVPYSRLQCAPSGFEWFAVADAEAAALKDHAVSIEGTHPLGRLFDFDVHPAAGAVLGRSGIGRPARTCLLCDRPAHECARSRRHPLAELAARIETLVDGFLTRFPGD